MTNLLQREQTSGKYTIRAVQGLGAVKIDVFSEREIVSDTVLDALARAGLFSVCTDGHSFVLTELCEQWQHVFLTKQQLIALGTELIDLAKEREGGN